MSSIPNCEPKSFVAGDTVQWRRSFSNYPPADGWALAYTFVNASAKQQVAAGVDESGYLVTIDAASSKDWAAGNYNWQANVTKAGERYTVDTGALEVLPNLVDAPETGFDARSDWQKVLDAIDAQIAGRATKGQLDLVEYHIGIRGARRSEGDESLLKLRGEVAARVWQDLNKGHLGPIVQGIFL